MSVDLFALDSQLDIPNFLVRDPQTNEFMHWKPSTSGVLPMYRTSLPTPVFAPEAAASGDEAPAPRKAKANGKAPVKAKASAKAAKPKAKVKAKAKERNVDQSKLDQFGLRLSSIKSKAAAMYAAKGGATLGEVKEKLESTQFNVLTELKERGFTVDTKQEDGEGNRKVTRYFVKAKAKK